MKKVVALCAVLLSLGMVTVDAEAARRLGGGKSLGMQRQNVSPPPKAPTQGAQGTQAPAQGAPAQAAPAASTAAAAAPAAAAAAAPRRSWMGPVAGIAAGLGIAALASHFGFGEALANLLTIGLIAMAVMLLVGFVLRKRAAGQGPALAGAGAGMRGAAGGAAAPRQEATLRSAHDVRGGSMIGSRLGAGTAAGMAPAASGVGTIPADFDVPAFVRNAKAHFTGLQAAHDARDLERLRTYLTPEMFELVRGELASHGEAPVRTEVFGLEAQVLDVAEVGGDYVVSVRFTGSVRDEPGVAPDDLDETWHLTKPRAGQGGWVVAGIQQA
ncbi:Tim44-like domain-containing protein [Ramlibacter sp. AN1015]|uniref:Tim44 domain-containing protein n=1 Tax=Ramlibacter sp. AN1015 TaxID=3133428 RepID=UPI0030C00B36